MYGALSDAPPSAADAPAVQAAKQQLARAAEAAGAAHDALRRALDEAERAEESRGRAALDAAEERLAIAPTGYMGYLHHLQEGRQRIQTQLQTMPGGFVPSKEIERAAAAEWAELGADARRDAMQRAYQHCLRQAVENAPPTPAKKGRRVMAAAAAAARRRTRWRGSPRSRRGGGGGACRARCAASATIATASRCGGCDKASCHLMCVWPPLETEEGAEWRCLSCATPEALAEEHALPSVGEAIEVAGPAEGVWRPATVRRAKGGRLVAGSADPRRRRRRRRRARRRARRRRRCRSSSMSLG